MMIRDQSSFDTADSFGDSFDSSGPRFSTSGASLSQPFSPNTSIHASSTPLPPPETSSTPATSIPATMCTSASAAVGLAASSPANASVTGAAAAARVLGSPLSTSAIRNAIADVSNLQGWSPRAEDTTQTQNTSSVTQPWDGLLPGPAPEVAPLPPPILPSLGLGPSAVENGFYTMSPSSRCMQSNTSEAEASLGAHASWSPSNATWNDPNQMCGQQMTPMQHMAPMRQLQQLPMQQMPMHHMQLMQEMALIAPMQQMPMQRMHMPQMQQIQQMPVQQMSMHQMPMQQMQQMQQMPMQLQMQQMRQMPISMPMPMQLPSVLPQPPPSLLGVYPGPMMVEDVTPAYPVPIEYPSPINVDNAPPEYAIEYYNNAIQALTFQKTQLPGVANKRKRQKLNSKIDTLTKKRNVLLMQQQPALFMRDAHLNPAEQLYAFGAPATLQTADNGSANASSVPNTTSAARSSLNVKAPTFTMPGAAPTATTSASSSPVQVEVEENIRSLISAVAPVALHAPETAAPAAGQQQVAKTAPAEEVESSVGFTSVEELSVAAAAPLAPVPADATFEQERGYVAEEVEEAETAPRPWNTVVALPPKKASLSAQKPHTFPGGPAKQSSSRRLTVLSFKTPRANLPAQMVRDPALAAVASASKQLRAPAKDTQTDRKRQSNPKPRRAEKATVTAAAGTHAPSLAAPQHQQTRRRSSSSSSSFAVTAPLDKENASATPRRRAPAKQFAGPAPQQQQQGTLEYRRVSLAVQLRPTGIKLAGTPRGIADGVLPGQDSPGGVVEASLHGLVGLKPTGLLKDGNVLRRNKKEKRPESRDGRRESLAFHEKRAMWM